MKQNSTFQEGVADLKCTTTPLTTQPDNSQTLDLSNEVALQPLELQRLIVPHWKALMSDCLEPAGQGLGRTFRVH